MSPADHGAASGARPGTARSADPSHDEAKAPMFVEVRLFGAGLLFFGPVAVIYGLLTDWEATGSTALLLLAGLSALIGGYLWVVSRRIDPRPEDDPFAEIADGAGDQGVFSPWSWWPLVLAGAAALAFLGLAAGWWIFFVGVAAGALALVGWVFEFSRGQHAH